MQATRTFVCRAFLEMPTGLPRVRGHTQAVGHRSWAQSAGKREHGCCGMYMAYGVLGLHVIRQGWVSADKRSRFQPCCEHSIIRCWGRQAM